MRKFQVCLEILQEFFCPEIDEGEVITLRYQRPLCFLLVSVGSVSSGHKKLY
jgi:hypothetical protein